eukprot:Hpha_TRINITY_DN6983_c0_g1::TRINITY_DN6983_c0_g1_i1::g.139429::m.139429
MPLPETPRGLTKVYIDFLPREGSDGLSAELEAFFNCGKIVRLLKKPGKTNGYAIFRRPQSVRVALLKDGQTFRGRKLRIEIPRGIVGEGDVEDLKARKETFRDRRAKLDKIDPQKQIFVSALAKPVNEDILKDFIAQVCGQNVLKEIQAVKMIPKKGAAFVTLGDVRRAQLLAPALNNMPLLGMKVRAAVSAAPGTLKPQGKKGDEEGDEEDEAEETPASTKPAVKRPPLPPGCVQVLVGGLPDDATVEEVGGMFKQCGQQNGVKIIRHRITGAPIGVASIRFGHSKAAKNAVGLSEKVELRGSALTVEYDPDAPTGPKVPQYGKGKFKGKQRGGAGGQPPGGESVGGAKRKRADDASSPAPPAKRQSGTSTRGGDTSGAPKRRFVVPTTKESATGGGSATATTPGGKRKHSAKKRR